MKSRIDRLLGAVLVLLIASSLGWLGWEKTFVSTVTLGKDFGAKGVIQDPPGADRYTVPQGGSFPVLGFAVQLQVNTHYRVCLPVSHASQAVSVVIDVVGSGYDNAAQEHRFGIVKSSSPRDYCFNFDSESSPADTGLRVMFDGVNGVMPGEVEIAKPRLEKVTLPSLMQVLKSASLLFLVLTCLLSTWVGAKKLVLEKSENGEIKLIAAALWFLIPAAACFALWAAFSSATPWVFSDEYTYAWLSKHGGDLAGAANVGLVSTIAHSFIYFWVYGAAFINYSDPYVFVKAINIAFWLGSAAVSYIAARRLLPSLHSAVLALSVLAGPWMIFTRLFMPEAMYYFGFWCCVAIFVWNWNGGSLKGEVAVGVALGCLSLVKSHALFLIPGFAVGAMVGHACSEIAGKRTRGLMVVSSALALGFSWYVSKLALTHYFGHVTDGGGLAGGYGGLLGQVISVFGDLPRLLSVIEVFIRHAGISVLAGGGALAFAGAWGIRKIRLALSSDQRMAADDLLGIVVTVSALVSLLVLLSITALFTVSVAGSGPFESVARTHTRYYGFILPFVLLAGMSAVHHFKSFEPRGRLERLLTAMCILFGFGALLVQASTLNANDGPDALLFAIPVFGWIVLAAHTLFVGFFTSFPARFGALAIGAWGTIFGLANVGTYVYRYYDMTSVLSAGESAGVSAAFHIHETERDRGLVLSKDVPIDLYRLMFHLNGRSPVRVESDCRAAMQKAKNRTYDWVIAYGYSESCAPGVPFELLGENVRLYRFSRVAGLLSPSEEITAERAYTRKWVFGSSDQIRLISAHTAEPWGVWIPPQGYFELAQPVNGTVIVELHSHGFGNNAGRKITAVLGQSRKTFVLSAVSEKHELIFANVTNASSLKFEGLEGHSPKSVGMGEDSRMLAMGIEGMEISLDDRPAIIRQSDE